ncbi:MAG: alpha/beta fold hydrolase [Gemmatimonadetes bacterium]|nr:alpha/beta fold hydrolase [Gemmatimonadota bacterium]
MIERSFILPFDRDRAIRGNVLIPDGPPPRSTIVAVHGFKGFKDWGFLPQVCESLAGDGHSVVSFNFSLNGISEDLETLGRLEDFARNTFSAEVGELLRVLAEVRSGAILPRPTRRIGLLGHSRGGGIAVLAARDAAREGTPVDAPVTWASVAHFDRWSPETQEEWRETGRIHVMSPRTGQHLPLDVGLLDDFEANRDRLDIERASSELETPWLVVHGDADTSVAVDDAHRLIRANPSARLEIVAGAGHTFETRHLFSGTTPALDHALSATRRHFRKYLVPEGTPSVAP